MKFFSNIGVLAAAGPASPPQSGFGGKGEHAAFAAIMDGPVSSGDVGDAGAGDTAASTLMPGVTIFNAVATPITRHDGSSSSRMADPGAVVAPGAPADLATVVGALSVRASSPMPARSAGSSGISADTSTEPRSDKPVRAADTASSPSSSDLMAFLIASVQSVDTPANVAPAAPAGLPPGPMPTFVPSPPLPGSVPVADAIAGAQESAFSQPPAPPAVDPADAFSLQAVPIATALVQTRQDLARTRPPISKSGVAKPDPAALPQAARAEEPTPVQPSAAPAAGPVDALPLKAVTITSVSIETHQGFLRGLSPRSVVSAAGSVKLDAAAASAQAVRAEEPAPSPPSAASSIAPSDALPFDAVTTTDVSPAMHQVFARGLSMPTSDAVKPDTVPASPPAAHDASSVPATAAAFGNDPADRSWPTAFTVSNDPSSPSPAHVLLPETPTTGAEHQVLNSWVGTPAIIPVAVARAAGAVVSLASGPAVPEIEGQPRVAPARSMMLQLAPEGLGTLSVQLHVVGKALDVRLAASDANTASLLDDHRDVLSTALSDEGYRVQTLSIALHDADSQGNIHAARPDDAAANANNFDGGGGSAGSDVGRRREREGKERRPVPSSRRSDGVAPLGGGAGLFV